MVRHGSTLGIEYILIEISQPRTIRSSSLVIPSRKCLILKSVDGHSFPHLKTVRVAHDGFGEGLTNCS
jgi:hypothetical protein